MIGIVYFVTVELEGGPAARIMSVRVISGPTRSQTISTGTQFTGTHFGQSYSLSTRFLYRGAEKNVSFLSKLALHLASTLTFHALSNNAGSLEYGIYRTLSLERALSS